MSPALPERIVNEIRFTQYPLSLFAFTWLCQECSAVVVDIEVHAARCASHKALVERVRTLMDEREERLT